MAIFTYGMDVSLFYYHCARLDHCFAVEMANTCCILLSFCEWFRSWQRGRTRRYTVRSYSIYHTVTLQQIHMISISRYVEEKDSSSNFSFKCHRRDQSPTSKDQSLVFAVNDIAFHPVHGTFSTCGSHTSRLPSVTKTNLLTSRLSMQAPTAQLTFGTRMRGRV
jgi:hypothetical protein